MLRIVTAIAALCLLTAIDAPGWVYAAGALLAVITAPFNLRPARVLLITNPSPEQLQRWRSP